MSTAESTSLIVFRIPRRNFVIGILCAIFFALIGSFSVFASLFNVDGSFAHPIWEAIFFGTFWGIWLIFSLLLIAAYFREQLTISPEQITQQGLLRLRTTNITDITRLKWRRWPASGSAVVFYPTGRMTIHFGNFADDERLQLVDILHKQIPEDCQINWDAFFARRERTHQSQKRSAAFVCVVCFFFIGATFIYYWQVNAGPLLIYPGIACLIAGCWYLVRIARFVPAT